MIRRLPLVFRRTGIREPAQSMRTIWFWLTTVIAIVAVLAGGIALLVTMLHIVSGR